MDKNNKFYKIMIERLKRKKFTHSNASNYYNKLQKYVMYPSIGITALSSIASFVSTSEYVSSNVQNGFSLSVGILASVSTLLQSISSSCDYATKSELHANAAQEYDKLITKILFEIELPDEEEFVKTMEDSILEIQSKCKFIPPQFIIDEYDKKNILNENSLLINSE